MDFESSLKFIEKVCWQKSKLGLERTYELLELCGNPQNNLKFVHIAGTNGKGSVSAMLMSILRESGYMTGLYTSPYMLKFNERIQINGENIADDEFSEIITDMRSFIEKMADPPTEFEIVTAAAFAYFSKKNCDIVILEVGLGGELDSTNVIASPELCVITSIGFDHVKELGNTIEEIAAAKAGIIKSGSDVIFYGENSPAERVIREVCKNKNAKLSVSEFNYSNSSCDLSGIRFDCGDYKNIRVPLIGLHQFKNAILAIKAAELLAAKNWVITENKIYKGLLNTAWPGRFEVLVNNPVFIIDGAHNEPGIKAFADTYKNIFQSQRATFIVGVMADKDVDGIISSILPLAKRVIAVAPFNERSMKPELLAERVINGGCFAEAFSSVEEGVRWALKNTAAGEIICAVGSLYLYKQIKNSLEKFV